MLEQLFGSRTRVLMLRLFLEHHDDVFFVRQLTRLLGAQVYSVRRELENLVSFGVLQEAAAPRIPSGGEKNMPQGNGTEGKKNASTKKGKEAEGQKKYYALNKSFVLYPELKALFTKGRLLIEKELVEKIEGAGKIQLLILTGMFVGLQQWQTDMFIVGQVNKDKLRSVIEHFEKELQQPINYTVMTKEEFHYRRDITDRFIFNILENDRIVVIDHLLGK